MSRIIFNRKISSDYYKMRIFCPGIASRAKPGQFVMVRVNQLLDPLLRRPFGIHGLYREKDSGRGGGPILPALKSSTESQGREREYYLKEKRVKRLTC